MPPCRGSLFLGFHHALAERRAEGSTGTFVPFVVTICGLAPAAGGPLRFVDRTANVQTPSTRRVASVARVIPGETNSSVRRRRGLSDRSPRGSRITRGVAVRAGEYDLVVVARERVDPAMDALPRRDAGETADVA